MSQITVDFPRDLTQEETDRLKGALQAYYEQIEWERSTPSHVCEEVHAGKLHKTQDGVQHGVHPEDRNCTKTCRPQYASTYDNPLPTCHNCGSLLQRRGTETDTWVCSSVKSSPLLATKPDSAVECG